MEIVQNVNNYKLEQTWQTKTVADNYGFDRERSVRRRTCCSENK